MSSTDLLYPALQERFRVSDFVRWSDVDQAGIICYGSYVRFFEIAETELFRAVGLPNSQIFDLYDIWLPRAQLHFEFRQPARLDDRLDVEVWVAEIGRSSIRLHFEVSKSNGERILTAEGHEVLVVVGRGDLKPIPVPPGIVAALTPYRVPAAVRPSQG
ncbi:MAG TPA: thioesterase family protein [Thermoanaerobaculia bacterium]|nr:thioesterase family protein [Thermoanaerobaculia bacterium]